MRNIAKAVAYTLCSLALTVSLGGCYMHMEPDFMSAELDLSSVPEGLSVPGEQGLEAWYYELELAYEKGLMESLPERSQEIKGSDIPGGKPIMDGYFDAYYCQLYAYYRKAMEAYLLTTLRLDAYDKQVEDSGLYFIPVRDVSKGESHRLSVLRLDHLYIHNSPHIERLSEEDVAILKRLYDENGQAGTITQEALDLVARTYPELIRMYSQVTQAPYGTEYVIKSSGTMWNPDSLVIVFLAPYRSDENGNSISEDIPLMYQREDWLVAKLPKIRLQMLERVDVPVTLAASNSGNLWDITFDDKIWDGPVPYQPNPNRPKY